LQLFQVIRPETFGRSGCDKVDLLAKQQPGDPPHALTWPEIKSLGRVIEYKSFPADFQLRHINTCTWHGVPVLFVEGQHRIGGAGSIGFTMLANGDWPPVDVYLEATENPHAPEAEGKENSYVHFRPIAERILNSIVWKKSYLAKFPSKPSAAAPSADADNEINTGEMIVPMPKSIVH
jgi:hypothetical protein